MTSCLFKKMAIINLPHSASDLLVEPIVETEENKNL